ncbi:MAG TPA: XylR N-terminal domain-containing protein [Enhygromyxa sp.]|nr:XylR N-terminal domain-containing protein [Enhygromyxa sp.]
MRASDLMLDDLLEFQSDGGLLCFAGQRAMLVDSHALGLLRKELIDAFGLDAARQVMTRVGYAHGCHTADSLERALPWTSVDEWRRAGGRLHRLRGMATFEPVDERERDDPPAFVEAIWRDSYEVEQHLLHFGQVDHPVCWSISGFASGYLSRAYGRAVVCMEIQCRGRGDPQCRMRGDDRARLRFEPRSRNGGQLRRRDHGVDESLAAVERQHILAVLDASGGNKAEAARRLGIGTATLFRKLKRYRE